MNNDYLMKRIVATVIDYLIIGLIGTFLGLLATLVVLPFLGKGLLSNYAPFDLMTFTFYRSQLLSRIKPILGLHSTGLIGMIYFVLSTFYGNGQTLGKKIMNIKVVFDNDDIVLKKIFFREILKVLLFKQTITILVSTYLVYDRTNNKSIHDIVVKSSVIEV